MKKTILDGCSLTFEQITHIAYSTTGDHEVSVHPDSLVKMQKSKEIVANAAKADKAIYSINTGFGALANKKIAQEDLINLQYNLIRSHCVGVGEPFSREVTRAIILLRANCLISGFSGVSVDIVQRLLDFLNYDITPIIPSKGSVGASGDLAPLSHLSLALIGEAPVLYKGKTCPSDSALKDIGKEPAKLGIKDGLALINGTAVMTALGALALTQAHLLAKVADISSALTLEGIRGTTAAFDEKIHRVKPHPGQILVAENLRSLLVGSEIALSHKDCNRVQDPYSLRCIPQVHGASRQTINHAREVLEIEINSVTDNPLIFTESKDIISGGNFHGQAIAMAMDYLAMGMAELCSICERRIEKMMNTTFSKLPPFLAKKNGLNSGLMVAHVTTAALASENKYLCHPASIDSIPTSTDKEDHVSMGVTSGRKLHEVLDNLQKCLAIELLSNTQALEFLKPLKPLPPLQAVYDLIRTTVAPIHSDRAFYQDIAEIEKLIKTHQIINICEEKLRNPLK